MKEAKLDDTRTVLLVHVEGKGVFAMGAKCTHCEMSAGGFNMSRAVSRVLSTTHSSIL